MSRRAFAAAGLERFRRARELFASDAQMARLLGVSHYRLGRWKHHSRSAVDARLLDSLVMVRLAIGDLYEPACLPDWLLRINGPLGERRPTDAVLHGDVPEVLRAIAAERSGRLLASTEVADET